MSAPSPAEVNALVTSVLHLTAAYYYALASFAMLTYDILLTFAWEIDKIWKGRQFTGLTVLWTLNRWIFWLATIPTVVNFHDAAWKGKSCDHYFMYPGFVATSQRVIIVTVFMLRLYAIYGRKLWVPGVVAIFLLGEVATKLYAIIVLGTDVTAPQGFAGCILAVDQANSVKYMFFYLTELWTDTTVVIFTLYRSLVVFRSSNGTTPSRLWRVILKDGVAYYAVIFTVNVVQVVMYAAATLDLKAIHSSFGVMINSVMVARLILNLKSAASFDTNKTLTNGVVSTRLPGTQTMTKWEVAVLGDLGNELSTGWSSDQTRTVRSSDVRDSMDQGKDDVELGEEYQMRLRPGYGSYVYGYTGVEESSSNEHSTNPMTSSSRGLLRVSSTRVSAPTEYEPGSPMLDDAESHEMEQDQPPQRGPPWDRVGGKYEHSYLDGASSNPYLDRSMEFAPIPRTCKGRGKNPLPDISQQSAPR